VVLEATLSIAARERVEDRDYTMTRKEWTPDVANQKRAWSVLEFVYREDLPKILDRFSAHPDISELLF
jgi:hypothetical protein